MQKKKLTLIKAIFEMIVAFVVMVIEKSKLQPTTLHIDTLIPPAIILKIVSLLNLSLKAA